MPRIWIVNKRRLLPSCITATSALMALPKRESAAERGYDSRWRRAREHFLAKHPLCRACSDRGITKLAEVVDHVTPHRGDRKLFWDSSNWQPLCKHCHDSWKQRVESGGYVGCDLRGVPAGKAGWA